MHVYVCLLLYFMSMFASLDLGLAMLSAPHGFVLVWLHPSPLWFIWVWPLVRHIPLVPVCWMHTSARCNVACHACFVPLVCFLCFLASLHACLHVHAWVCVSSILQSNGTMDTRSKPTFVLLGHPFLFGNMLVCLFICLACFVFPRLVLFIFMFFTWSPYLLCFFFSCLLAYFLFCCMYMYGEKDAWNEGTTS